VSNFLNSPENNLLLGISMGRYQRLGKNTILVFIGNAGARLVGLLMLPFYTRWLSVEDYGTTDIINVYVYLLLGIVTACIAEAIFVFPKGKEIEQQKSYFSSGLLFAFCSLFITAVIFKIVKNIFLFEEISNSFTNNIWLIYGLLVTSFLQQYIQQFARSIDKMMVYSTTGIIVTISTAVCSFLIIPCWGVFGYVLALIFANLAGTAYSFFWSSAYRYFSITQIKKSTCGEMLRYSLPLIPNNIMWWVVGSFNRPLVENFLGMRAVGIFAVANKFPSILTTVFSIFSVSWQISVIEEFGKEGYAYFFNKIFRFITAILLFLFFIIVIFNRSIIGIFTTHDFYEASRYVPLLTLGAIFSSIASLTGSNFIATRESKYFFYSSIWGAVFSIFGNILLIPRLGLTGASMAILLSFIGMTVSRVVYGWRHVRIHNAGIYGLMLIIAILAIIVTRHVQTTWVKCSLVIVLFIVFLSINYSMKSDILIFCRMIKTSLLKIIYVKS
jgi:O-antigen/teichoic acid export membrane protein